MRHVSFTILALLLLAACGSGTSDQDSPSDLVAVRIGATTESYPHADGLSAQTARNVSGGISSLVLFRDADDLAPLVLFASEIPVEVGYDDGDDTVLVELEPAELPAGTFTLGRIVQDYSRFTIDATRHEDAEEVAGELEVVQVMSDDTVLDGELRQAGYYEHLFRADGTESAYTGGEGVYDFAPQTWYDLVEQFGGNRFDVTVE